MTTSSLLAEHTERSRLEDGIRAYELLLLKIDGDRIQVEVQLAECSLIRRLLTARPQGPRTRARNLPRAPSRTTPERNLNREQRV